MVHFNYVGLRQTVKSDLEAWGHYLTETLSIAVSLLG